MHTMSLKNIKKATAAGTTDSTEVLAPGNGVAGANAGSIEALAAHMAPRLCTEVKGKTFCKNNNCMLGYIEPGEQAYAVSDNHWHIKCFACCMCSVALHDSPCAVHSDKKTAQTRVYCNACYKKLQAPKWYLSKRFIFAAVFVFLALLALAVGLGVGLSNKRGKIVTGLTCSQPCSANGQCVTTDTYSACQCNAGYIGDGLVCAELA